MKFQSLIDYLNKDKSINVTGYKYLTAQPAVFGDIDIHAQLKNALSDMLITKLYQHQVEAISLIRHGKNVVIMTPTASGKSLIYNIPVIEDFLNNQTNRYLYIFPLKGLQQDQMLKLNTLMQMVYPNFSNDKNALRFAEVYDGDTSTYIRAKIRAKCPPAIFTNPDMLHVAMLPYHHKWATFFCNLKYIVIDEIHTYKGVFGSNVSHVFKRLKRICNFWGSNPQFIACTATISNPLEFSETIVGESFEVVQSARHSNAGKHFIFIMPYESPYSTATKIFNYCVSNGLRSIVFTKARKITELIYRWSIEANPSLSTKISPYRSGYLSTERREIERRLFSGELTGVISTSALELGVDIGGLDVCILCGYPGSISSTWQRVGRVGRGGQESLIIFIAINDALDYYFINNPDDFFRRAHEAATCDPHNAKILQKHLISAVQEQPLSKADKFYPEESIKNELRSLLLDKIIYKDRKNDVFKVNRLHIGFNKSGIRTIGEPFKLKNERLQIIGDLDGRRVYRDAFPGAIYLHRGIQYLVTEFDIDNKFAICRQTNVDYYSQALSEENVQILDILEYGKKVLKNGCYIFACRLKIDYLVTGYLKKHIFSGTVLETVDIEMPKYEFETEGIAMVFDVTLVRQLWGKGFDIDGALHAVEHVAISSIPLFFLSDKGDIGGYSYSTYPQLNQPVIFIYDGYDGGIGLTTRLTDIANHWLKASADILLNCDCEDGCPSCTHDSQCGSANKPLDKQGAVQLFKLMV